MALISKVRAGLTPIRDQQHMEEDKDNRLWLRVGQLQQQAIFMDKMVASALSSGLWNKPEVQEILNQQFLIWSEIRELLEHLGCQNNAHMEYFDRLIFERKMMFMLYNSRINAASPQKLNCGH